MIFPKDIVEDLKVENQRLKNKMSEKSRGDESMIDKQLERENRELRQELRQLHQETRQYRQRSFSRNRSLINNYWISHFTDIYSGMHSSQNSIQETGEEKRLKAENSLLVNRLRDLTDEIRDIKIRDSRHYSFS